MSETGSTAIEPYPHAYKPKCLNNGIVKFPVNVHGIYVEKSASGYTTITAKQNDVVMRFVYRFARENGNRHKSTALRQNDATESSNPFCSNI
jgi:hypothetical protein